MFLYFILTITFFKKINFCINKPAWMAALYRLLLMSQAVNYFCKSIKS